MRSKLFRVFALFVILAMFLSSFNTRVAQAVSNQPDATPPSPGSITVNENSGLKIVDDLSPAGGKDINAGTATVVHGVSETGLYIVRLQDPSLAMYTGGITNLAATSPQVTGSRNLDVRSPASAAYINYLDKQQADLISSIDAAMGRSVDIEFAYKNVLNAVAVRVSYEEAVSIAQLPGVKGVYGDQLRNLDTDVGPTWIGAPAIWNGDTGTGAATQGEGIIIGMIDSGINHANPSFADVGGDGYDTTNPYGAGVYVGYCIANPSFCNDKLIGAYDLYTGGSGGPEDTAGHGSHTSSTAGGNHVVASVVFGSQTITRTISGVAPHANLIAYKVCNPSCPESSSIMAVEHAITDTVDVLNYSISGSDDPWNDPVDQAFLDANAAGIFVATSAGNSGPGASTLAHTGPWEATVGASTHTRIFANPFDVTDPLPVPSDLVGLIAMQGTGPALTSDISAPIAYDPANLDGCAAFASDFFTGTLALIQRGACNFSVKVDNAADAGALGVLVFNNQGGPPIIMGSLETTLIPSVMLTLNDGLAVKDWIDANPSTAAGMLHATVEAIIDPSLADIMADFSSRGPSRLNVLKPDFVAPGVNILAALNADGVDPNQWGLLSGTSMASPHTAGSAALMMSLYPSWSPAAIKSALATSAFNGPSLRDNDGVTPVDPFDAGSGRLALGDASNVGLVFDETAADFVAADPGMGGDPRMLNLPNFQDNTCYQACSWTRSVYNPTSAPMTWEASYTGDGIASISPTSFTIAAGATFTFTFGVDVHDLSPDTWHFGDLVWSEASGLAPDVKLPVAVDAVRSTDASVIEKEVSQGYAIVGDTLAYTVTVKNASSITQTYMLTDVVPAHTTYVDSSATGGLVYHPITNTLTWNGEIGPTDLFISEGSRYGYVSLAGLGAQPFDLPSNPDDGGWILGGMDFYYNGQHYDRVIWSVNGTIEAGSASGIAAPGANTNLPNSQPPNNLLAPWWTDLDLTSAGNWYVGGLSDSGRNFTVFEWEDVPRFGDLASTATFQVWIEDGTDNIWFAYPSGAFTGSTTDGTIGAENSDATLGDSYYYDGAGTLPDGSNDLLVEQLQSAPVGLSFQADVSEMTSEVMNTADLMDGMSVANQAYALTMIGEPPMADFTDNSPVMVGETAVFTPTVTGTGPFEYMWDFGDGSTSTVEMATHVFTDTGTFTVTLMVMSNYGTDTAAHPYVAVGVPPTAMFTSNSPIMLGDTAIFTPTVTGTGPFDYMWDFGDGITSTMDVPTHTYMMTDTYTVTLMVSSMWGSDSYMADFVVNPRTLLDVYLPVISRIPTP